MTPIVRDTGSMIAGLSPELQAISPSNPANLTGALRTDPGFWRDNGAKLRQRFDAWLEH